MIYKNKSFYFLRHIFQMALKSNARLFLSLMGLVVGLFIFSLSNIILNSYYKGMFDQINEMKGTAIAAELSSENESILQKVREFGTINPAEAAVSDTRPLIYYKNINDKIYHSVSANVIGVSNINSSVPVLYNNKPQIVADVRLLKGRLLTENDHALQNEVAVIDRFTESILFPEGNSLGNVIKLNIEIPGLSSVSTSKSTNEPAEQQELTVVGVIDNLYSSNHAELQYKKGMNEQKDHIFTYINIYSPLSAVKNRIESKSVNSVFIWDYKDEQQKLTDANKLESYHQIYHSQIQEFTLSTKEKLIEEETKTLYPLKMFINILMLLFLTISGISVMSIMFFSIKERVPEIGIKKAYGASKIDIVIQFIFEGIILSIVGAIVAISLSIITAAALQYFILNSLFINFTLDLSAETILLPLFISGIFGFVFCLIPSLYGAKIPVTDALRFD